MLKMSEDKSQRLHLQLVLWCGLYSNVIVAMKCKYYRTFVMLIIAIIIIIFTWYNSVFPLFSLYSPLNAFLNVCILLLGTLLCGLQYDCRHKVPHFISGILWLCTIPFYSVFFWSDKIAWFKWGNKKSKVLPLLKRKC